MRLTGSQIVDTIPSKVWEILMNPISLARVVPGIASLERLSEHSYKATLDLKIGPVNGLFSGNLELHNIIEEKSFTLRTQQHSKIGNANANVQIKLDALGNNQTEVIFDGDVKLSGMLASM